MTAFNETFTETVTLTDTLRKVRPGVLRAESARVAASNLLRLLRRPLRYVTVDLPLGYSHLEPGDTVWATHDLIPEMTASTSLTDKWRLVPLYVLSVADSIQPPKITLKCVDLREAYCTWWSPLKTDVGMTDDLQGIAIFDQSGGWETVRAQVAFGERPGGDQTYQSVAEDTAVLDTYGLLAQGGGDTNLLLNSSFSEGSGTTFTSWTKTTTGTAIVAELDLYTLIDADGYRRACQVVTYLTGETSYLSQTVNTVDDMFLYVRFWYRDGGTIDPTKIWIVRSDTGDYWRDSDGTWQVAATYNAVPASSAVGQSLWTSKLLDMTGISCNLTISAGYPGAVANAEQIISLEGIELLKLSDTFTDYAFESMRGPLPTKAATVTRVESVTYINNDSATRVLEGTRGFVKVDVTPLWSHSQIGDAFKKYIWCAEWDQDNNSSLRCYYERMSSTEGRWTLSKIFSGTVAYAYLTVTSGAGTLPVAGTTYSVACRWNSYTEDEFGLTGQAIQLWVDGVLGEVSDDNTPDPLISAVSRVYLGCLLPFDVGFSDGSYEYADAHLTNLVIGKHCPTDEELARY